MTPQEFEENAQMFSGDPEWTLEVEEFERLESDDWLMDINGVKEEFDPETQKLLAQF
tara:strand:- start:6463 stop:6633 length:171 start_codon:yes stop_codon:yes gene_type:complete